MFLRVVLVRGLCTSCPFKILDSQTDVDGNFQSFQDPSYQDYRAEAQTHFELRTAAIKKAALAYSKKQGELAKIYADQVRTIGYGVISVRSQLVFCFSLC